MTSYGGFTKTSYRGQGGDDAGGFVHNGSQPGSQGQGKSYSDETLRPVTIKQLIDAEETFPSSNEFRIDNQPVTQITVVAQIRSINKQTTHIQYKIDDGTAVIEVKKYLDADKVEEIDTAGELEQHVRIYGRLKQFSGRRFIGALVIRPVPDYNEVQYHLLEAAAVHLYFTRGALGGQQGGGDGGGDSMFVDTDYNNGGAGGGMGVGGGGGGGAGGGSRLVGCSPAAHKMYNFLLKTPGGNEGVHLQTIASNSGLSVRDVLAASDELLGQGVIYTTVDDETWAVLDF